MGILSDQLEFMKELPLPKGFAVCELGDQYVTSGTPEHYLASKFYKQLGCHRYEAIDANGRGTIAADLNRPFEEWGFKNLRGQFHLVTDFGTGEHVFNQYEVWRAIHELCQPGGYIVFDRPTVGYEGHCFYLIQWNMVSALAWANAYEVLRLEERSMSRGILLRGVLRRQNDKPFQSPQQGRYVKDLVVDQKARALGPDHKSVELRAAGVIISRKKVTFP